MSQDSAFQLPTDTGTGRYGIVVSRYNPAITESLAAAAIACLVEQGVTAERIMRVSVPGAIEIPLMARKLIEQFRPVAVIALGAVIRGETGHYAEVCSMVSSGLMQVMLATGTPIAMGILTTDTLDQARERAGGRHGNKGRDAALTALEMAGKMQAPAMRQE